MQNWLPAWKMNLHLQAAKRLKSSAKGYSCLERLDEECEDRKGSITAVYKYEPINVSIPFEGNDKRYSRYVGSV